MKKSVGMINVPAGAGADDTRKCWHIMEAKCDRFGVNEVLYAWQKALYLVIARKNGYGVAGIRHSPNPVFFDKSLYRKTFQRTVKLHDRGPNFKKDPGFNEARYANVVVLVEKGNQLTETHINIHLAAFNRNKVPDAWVFAKHRESLALIRELVEAGLKKGDVWLYGDFNIHELLTFDNIDGGRVEGIKPRGVDKVYHFAKGEQGVKVKHKAIELPAPTDHKHGIYARRV